MKQLDAKKIDQMPGKRLDENTSFSFKCHSEVSCFNQCCRNLNLMLYPYDVVRLKNSLEMSSDRFLTEHTNLVLRPSGFFPEVLLKMSENDEKTCPFLTSSGCSVYPDRPDACRTFPLEQGVIFNEGTDAARFVYFFRPPDFCMGKHEDTVWTPDTWISDQDAWEYRKMTVEWAKLVRLFSTDPWQGLGMENPKAKMAFMAAYNVDLFRDFVFNSTFLKRYKVKADVLKRLKAGSDKVLMQFGFEWIRFYTWGISSKQIKLKRKIR